jgi:hypothetical protein
VKGRSNEKENAQVVRHRMHSPCDVVAAACMCGFSVFALFFLFFRLTASRFPFAYPLSLQMSFVCVCVCDVSFFFFLEVEYALS